MDLFETWEISFSPGSIIEVKGIYHIPSKKKEESSPLFIEPRRYSATSIKKEGKSSSHRKCELSLYYKVEEWKEGISVKALSKGLETLLLKEGFLYLQDRKTYWSCFRIRDLSNIVTRKNIITAPLFECNGQGMGSAKNDRAFVFNIYEKYSKVSRKVHLRGCCEELKTYGTTGENLSPELKKSVQVCESLFIGSLEPVSGVILTSDRLITERKKSGIYDVNPIFACLGSGIVDQPEEGPTRPRKKKFRG